ncbi:MAG: MBL fold metallo-hydrolase [Nannocystaceae bacterium]
MSEATHEVLAPGIVRMALRTPTLPPATATNTLIAGRRRLAVIEPASPYREQQELLEAYLRQEQAAGAEIVGILLTHHHRDHVGHVERLREVCGAPVMAHPETSARVSFDVDISLEDGELVTLDEGHRLLARHTPGHAPGHLIFADERSDVVYVGDMLAGVGTILIEPGDGGDMGAYLESLRMIRDEVCGDRTRLVPSHGPVITDGRRACEALIEHRLRRESKVVEGVGAEGCSFDELLAIAYDDTPKTLWPLAAMSLEAHVQKLIADGRIRRSAGRIVPV